MDNSAAERFLRPDTGRTLWRIHDDMRRQDNQQLIKEAVGAAIDHLDEDERALIVQHYFLGRTLSDIAIRSGRQFHRLLSLHRQAIDRLRHQLAPFVKLLFDVEYTTPDCEICRSPYREEIDQIIAGRDRRETWWPVLKAIQDRLGLTIDSAQSLMGHEKYHLNG